MAAYPSYTSIPQAAQSRRRPIGRSHIVDVAEDGTLRGANYEAVTPYEFTIVHPHRPIADADTIEAHYAGEGASAFAFTWALDDAAYTCYYAGAPTVDPVGSGNAYVDISVVLWGTKD